MEVYENVLVTIISKNISYVFNLVKADIEHQKLIMSYFNNYRFVDVIMPLGAVFWMPFLFLFALKMKPLYKIFIIYQIVSYAILYSLGILIIANFDALYLLFNLFQMFMIFMGLTFCLLGAKQLISLK